MEVCGGHTHSIFRYGIEGLLPKSIELVHGPGCPVCVLPMGRVDDCVAIAEQPGVIFTTFGDAMRVPGSRKSLLQAKADGADVRMVYSPMDALGIWRERNPEREVVFLRPSASRPRCRRPRSPFLQAEREGVANFSVFCNHITIVPTIKAILDSPDLKLDGFLGPGHVSMVIGTAPYEFIARLLPQADGGRRVRAARHPAIDLDGAAADQRGPRRDREPVCPHRAGRRQRGGAATRSAQVYELREFFEWRGLGSIDHSGVRMRAAYARFDAERKFAVPSVQDRRPEIVPMRRGAERRDQAVAVQGVRHAPARRRRRSAR